jgi:predicted permease
MTSRPLAALRTRLRALLRRGTIEREMQEEMSAHLEQTTARLMTRGLSPEDAELEARREFGNVGVIQEEGRDARGGRWLDDLIADTRFALRHFARRPMLAVTVVLVLMLGIGVNTAFFSFIRAVMLRPAPGVPNRPDLVRIRALEQTPGGNIDLRGMSPADLDAIAAHRDVFASVAAWANETVVITGADGVRATTTDAQFVTPAFFTTLGIAQNLPVYDEANGEIPVVLSQALWRSAFGSAEDIVGSTIHIGATPVKVVGVAQPAFRGAVMQASFHPLWVPLGAHHRFVDKDSVSLRAFARLQPGVSIERADAVASAVVAPVHDPAIKRKPLADQVDIVRLRGLTEETDRTEVAVILTLLGGGALLILLITCTNVSALLVGAAVARRQEIAVRLSLGAARWRVIRQLLTETSLLAVGGGLLGVMVYWIVIKVATRYVPDLPLALDWLTVVYTALFACATGIVFGLAPALHTTRLGIADVLKASSTGATRRSRLQNAFVTAQIALTQPLLVGLAVMILMLLVQTGTRQLAMERSERLIRASFDLILSKGAEATARRQRLAEFMQRVSAMPGVARVIPEPVGVEVVRVTDVGLSERFIVDATSPGYFAFIGARIERGRDVAWSDTTLADWQVVIGSVEAHRLWGNSDPIGKRLPIADGPARALVVVGVYDSNNGTTRGEDEDRVFMAGLTRGDRFLIQTVNPAETMVPTIQALALREIPRDPLQRIVTIAQADADARLELMRISGLAGAGGLLALFLASIGLYAAMSIAVGLRRREIAIRVAVGAHADRVVGMFFARGLRTTITGLVLGLPLSLLALWLFTRAIGVLPVNTWSVGVAVSFVVLAVGAVANWIPARRAAHVDPILALRVE